MNAEILKENFIKFLKREGLKNTPERHVVLETISGLERHFDVDELCAQLFNEGKRVSKATVYRTIELLVKGGFIKRVIYGERQARYEWNYQVKYHEHLICVDCERIFEFYSPELERIKGTIFESLDFRPRDSHVELRGRCRTYERTGACPHRHESGPPPIEERIIRIDLSGKHPMPWMPGEAGSGEPDAGASGGASTR